MPHARQRHKRIKIVDNPATDVPCCFTSHTSAGTVQEGGIQDESQDHSGSLLYLHLRFDTLKFCFRKAALHASQCDDPLQEIELFMSFSEETIEVLEPVVEVLRARFSAKKREKLFPKCVPAVGLCGCQFWRKPHTLRAGSFTSSVKKTRRRQRKMMEVLFPPLATRAASKHKQHKRDDAP